MVLHTTAAVLVLAVEALTGPGPETALRSDAASGVDGVARVSLVQDAFPRGEVVERVRSTADTSETFALYLPSRYDPKTAWPVLFLMDPRGRALVPMALFREPAERLGYVVFSAYGTRSDGPREPNRRALEAMLRDAQRRFSIDQRRLYLVGFSGTARAAWAFAGQLRGRVAGVIGFGAGLPLRTALTDYTGGEEDPFGFFGGAGHLDFNYEEMRALEVSLQAAGLAHSLRFWSGGHGWPPADVAAAAVEWSEADAMRRGLHPPDVGWLTETAAEWMGEANRLRDEGRLLAALRQYRSTARAFDGLLDVPEAAARAEDLAADPEVRRAQEKAAEFAASQQEAEERLLEVMVEAHLTEEPPQPDEATRRLGIPRLLQTAADSVDRPERADAATRVLATIFAQFAYYQPRAFLEAGRPEHALAFLEVAERIWPRRAELCYHRALAHAVAGRREEALTHFECALERAPFLALEARREEEFASLRDEPRYDAARRRALQTLRRERGRGGGAR